MKKNNILRAALSLGALTLSGQLFAEQLDVEKDELKFGFIKLTDLSLIHI